MQPNDGSRGGFAWRRTLLKLVVSTALMVFLLQKISFHELARLLRELDTRFLAAAVLCFFTSNVIGSFQWYTLLTAGGIRLEFGRAFRFYFVGLFFNNFLPANIGGDAVKIYDVTRVGGGGGVYPVVAVTVLDRIIGIFSLCLLACVGAVIIIAMGSPTPYAYYLVIFLACMAPASGLYFFKPLSNLLRAVVSRIRPLRLDRRISSVLDHLGHFKARKRMVMRLIFLSLAIQTLRVSTHVLVGMALGIRPDLQILCQFLVFVPLLSLAMIPPVTINGLGVREGLGILLFAAAGLARTDAFTLEFLTYVVSVAVSLIGLGFFLTRRGRGRAPEAV